MDDTTRLGPIVRLQLQKEPLVVGVLPDRAYRTEPLTSLGSITLTPEGVLGRIDSGWVVDVHHTAHPANARPSLDRLLSIGFTGHYAAMEDHFGEAPIGIAGENIVVETDRIITQDDIAGGIVIRRPGGDIELKGAAVAAPCVAFTRFLLKDQATPLETVKPHRNFLHNGMRGYVMGLANLASALDVSVGDEVYVRT